VDLIGFVLTAVASYLLGSIPTGYLVAKARGIDIRSVGSGNIGATNAFRVLGPAAGSFVLAVDLIKGFVACYSVAFGPQITETHHMVAGIGAILGHNYTCWLRFKGGKGVATSAGVLLGWTPPGFAVALATFLIILAVTKYVSLASICAAAMLPVAVWLTGGSQKMIILTAFVGAMAIYKHRSNIQRLIAGTESKIGRKTKI
jgi:glycerol-3-phosphate acyltransferase PlsY